MRLHGQWIGVAVCAVACAAVVAGCTIGPSPAEREAAPRRPPRRGVRPGITVLLDDSVHLVRGRRVGLLTNQTGVNERGESDADLLRTDPRATRAGVRLTTLFSPEHGIRGELDEENVASTVDARTGLPVISLYGAGTQPPPDSALRRLDVLVFDLPDIGTRTWTYVGELVYSLRAVRRANIPLVVLDRPAPISGRHVSGPMLDSALANPEDPAPGRPGRAYALWPFPLRHGLTMGEMARFYNETLGIGADLHVVPMQGYRRAMWADETGLPWIRPSPSMPSVASALVYPTLVAFERSNVSVGRGTDSPFQRFGAPWLRADSVARLLNDRELAGVRFRVEAFTPVDPGDGKYNRKRIPGVRVEVVDRNKVEVGRVGAAILWALGRANADSLTVEPLGFDHRFGSPAAREALLRGEDPDAVMDRALPGVVAFNTRARRFHLYR
jgi:uncharacterized protein YbbC (DUF1343 family)